MKAKILSVLIVVIITAFTAQAQDSGIRAGILGGVNFYNLTIEEDGDKMENNLLPGFHIGANLLIPVATDFYFHPGLLFSGKGAKVDEDDATFRISYIELPVNFLYRGKLGEGFVMVGFGPYLGFGISGKIKGDGEEIDLKFKNEISQEDLGDAPYVKPLDAGANIFVGFELSSGLFFQLNSQLGLMNISPKIEGESDNDSSAKNTGFGLSLGYRF